MKRLPNFRIINLPILLIALLALSCFAFAEDEKAEIVEDAWNPGLSMQYNDIQSVAISPDGKYAAYVVRKPLMEGEKSEFLSHIWLAATDGSSDVQYTRGEKSCGNPSFSPDGKYLAFTSSRGGKKSQLWIMRVMGGEAEKITDAKSGVGSYRWSPDGKKIAYLMQDPKTKEEEKAAKEKRDVILVDQNFKYSHIYTVAIAKNADDERDVQRVTAGDYHISSFDWTPDGSRLVFAWHPEPTFNTRFLAGEIASVSADSGEVSQIVNRPGQDNSPRVSPDGKYVAFLSHGGSIQAIGIRDIYIAPLAGGDPVKLGDTHDRNAAIVGWSADSKRIFYREAKGTSRNLFALPVNGKAPKMISADVGNVDDVAIDRKNNMMAFTYEESDKPVDVYVSRVKKFTPKRISNINDGIARPLMGKTEILTWKSKDGLEIEGLLTYPVDYVAGKKYPLVLTIHGGPAGVFTEYFTGGRGIYMVQTFAENGYAVLRPNPRGSSGYGKEFRYANFQDWGHGDYEDLMSGVDKVIEMGIAHEDSLCAMGWSYGGYMTSYLVTRTGRFKAASMGAGLPNLVSMVTTTDIPDYLVAHMGGEFWEDYETYEKHSAIYRIAEVTTPTQVIHGANDLRVPFTQGQEFYVALKRRGIDTEMVVYPRTPHGPREPKFLMDVTPRILTWFEKHLGRKMVTTGTEMSNLEN